MTHPQGRPVMSHDTSMSVTPLCHECFRLTHDDAHYARLALSHCKWHDTECEEWCERRLLHRIHRYTIKSLLQSIQPVSPQDFLRFLFQAWYYVKSFLPEFFHRPRISFVQMKEGKVIWETFQIKFSSYFIFIITSLSKIIITTFTEWIRISFNFLFTDLVNLIKWKLSAKQ